ncbi:MAG: hypothetical protein GY827_00055 [Cytophagales bacterium]|nr:hypothetical protein [Cytophagales bacterium]
MAMREEKHTTGEEALSRPSCQEFMGVLHLIVDGEDLTEDQKKFFKERLEGCSSSLNYYKNEKDLWKKIKTKLDIDSKCCPDCLPDQIMDKIKKG